MSFFRGELHKLHPINCANNCGNVQVTEQMSGLLGREAPHGIWMRRTALQLIAERILGADAVISPRGGRKHVRYCEECRPTEV